MDLNKEEPSAKGKTKFFVVGTLSMVTFLVLAASAVLYLHRIHISLVDLVKAHEWVLYHKASRLEEHKEERRSLSHKSFKGELILQYTSLTLPRDLKEVVRVEARASDGTWHLWPDWQVRERILLVVKNKYIPIPSEVGQENRDAEELRDIYTSGLPSEGAEEFKIVYR